MFDLNYFQNKLISGSNKYKISVMVYKMNFRKFQNVYWYDYGARLG